MKTPYLNAYIAAMEMVKESGNMDEDFEPVLKEFVKVRNKLKLLKPTQSTELSIPDVVERLVAFQNFLILDGQLDIEPEEVEKNAIAFTKAT